MKELLISIVSGLVEKPEEITVAMDEKNDDGVVVYHLHVAEDDMGRVISRQGRIAKAIRTVMRAAAKNSSRNRVKTECKSMTGLPRTKRRIGQRFSFFKFIIKVLKK